MMTAAVYKVSGMTCEGCANAVSRAVENKVGVARALVDLKAGTVAVEGPVSADIVRSAVEEAGFEFHGTA